MSSKRCVPADICVNADSIKFKPLSDKEIIISLDRITRFKPTEEKYLRVFFDIISSCLLAPKFKKKELYNLSYSDITAIATHIFNSSLPELSNDYRINDLIKEYENTVFKNNTETQTLLNNRIDIKSALKLIDDNTDVLNLKWLKSITSSKNIKDLRMSNKFLFPIEKIVITEGITEEILLPEFANLCGYNFNANGVKIIGAGGKNQVVKLYYELSDELKLPIFVLLDKDALSNLKSISVKLRSTDKVHLLEGGEFEDILPKELIVKTINNEFKNFVSIKKSDLDTDVSMVKTLEDIFKNKCLHEFKKADFAQQVSQRIRTSKDISKEVYSVIDEIKNL